MNVEQFEKLCTLCTGCLVGIFLSLIVLFLIFVLVFGEIYDRNKSRQDKQKKEDINSIIDNKLKGYDRTFMATQKYIEFLQKEIDKDKDNK